VVSDTKLPVVVSDIEPPVVMWIAHCQSCQVSRFTRESPGFRADLQVSRLVLKISRILTKIQLAKILSVLSKENPYVFVKWEIKKAKSEKVRSLLFK
jgi:hypothetical protein